MNQSITVTRIQNRVYNMMIAEPVMHFPCSHVIFGNNCFTVFILDDNVLPYCFFSVLHGEFLNCSEAELLLSHLLNCSAWLNICAYADSLCVNMLACVCVCMQMRCKGRFNSVTADVVNSNWTRGKRYDWRTWSAI